MHVAVINEGCRLRALVKNCLIEKGGVEIDNPENVTSVCLTLIFEKYFWIVKIKGHKYGATVCHHSIFVLLEYIY